LAKKNRWLLLIHQIPRTPGYLRVKIWRRLQRLGAVAIKNSVYAVPAGDQALEDLVWVLREIEKGGGEASICEATFVEGVTDDEVEAMFRAARDADYQSIVVDARGLGERKSRVRTSAADERTLDDDIARLKKRLDDVSAIDFFGAPLRDQASAGVGRLQARGSADVLSTTPISMRGLKGKTWVTRRDVFVDRMASAWLIKRFIDPKARFKFVAAKGYKRRSDELRFDMFGGEFTHEGGDCTFEVLVRRAGLKESALRIISQIIHDIDLKDAKFGRLESPGIERVLQGISMALGDDAARLERSAPVFDDLYRLFGKKRK
jgi:hypothetical protein